MEHCILCHEIKHPKNPDSEMIKTGAFECCKAHVHKDCLKQWKENSKNTLQCFHCRATPMCKCGKRHTVEEMEIDMFFFNILKEIFSN